MKKINTTTLCCFFPAPQNFWFKASLIALMLHLSLFQGLANNIFSQDYTVRHFTDQAVCDVFRGTTSDNLLKKHEKFAESALGQLQETIVKGKVKDAATGEPMPYVNVVVEGTTTGVITNNQGEYSIVIPDTKTTLIFSFVGYATQKIAIEGRTTIDVALKLDATQLNEFVVVAYGTQKKRDVIGSIAQLKGGDISDKKAGNFIETMQGALSGVQVTTNTSTPGGSVQVRIRGINSINSDSKPLWVIDGVPMLDENLGQGRTTFGMLNPNDIQSIDVLKDAGATSMYGSRASGGVVLITTKSGKGKSGKGTFAVDVSSGISRFTKTNIGMANSAQFRAIMDSAVRNTNNTNYNIKQWYNIGPDNQIKDDVSLWQPNNNGFIGAVKPITREMADTTNSDWLGSVAKKNQIGSYKEFNVSASKNFENSNVFFSANYRNDQGIFLGNQLSKISSRLNANFTPLKGLTLGVRSFISFSNYQGMDADVWKQVNDEVPYRPIYDTEDPTGLWNPKTVSPTHPLTLVRRDLSINDGKTLKSMGNVSFNYDFPFIKGLMINGYVGYDFVQDNTVLWKSMLLSQKGLSSGAEEGVTSYSYTGNINVSYEHVIDKHKINLLVLHERQVDYGHHIQLAGEGTSFDYQEVGTPLTLTSYESSISNENYLSSYLAKAGYRFNERYLLEGSLRYDGSSKFAPDVRWHIFPAVSAGWIASEESFFKIKWINLLKLRGSIGETGNSFIPGNASYTQRSSYLGQFMTSPATSLVNIGNPMVTWETTRNHDIGFDYGILGNRINGSFAYYYRNVSGLLLRVPLPPSTGVSGGANSIWQNIGIMKNKGWEFNISATPITTKNFTWEIGFNFTTNHNKAESLYSQADSKGTGIISGSGLTLTKTGEPIGTYFISQSAGVNEQYGYPEFYQVDQALFDSTGKTQFTGHVDADGNFIPDRVPSFDGANRYFQTGKTAIPTYYGGFNSSFKYKWFDLNFDFVFSGGNYILNGTRNLFPYDGSGGNLTTEILEKSWKKPGDITEYPQLRYFSQYYTLNDDGTINNISVARGTQQSMNLEKGDYLRLKYVTFGFTLPSSITAKMKITSLRIYYTGTNLLTFTKFKGFDPEIGYGNIDGIWATNNVMPQTIVNSIGISLLF
jgi:TonB-linked SusC/RagA family outer membrane protein